MDASELATIAFEAMPMSVLTPIDQGQVYGVLAMALQTLEMQYGALLTEADEETAEAKKLWREALAELDALKVDRDAVLAANHALNVDLRNRTADLNAAIIARDASGADYAALAASFATMRQDRDKLSQQCDLMAAEFDAKQRELDELRSARDETVAGLQAENARLHRSLEERMSVRIPGAVPVARTEELHGMADVFAQSQRMQGNA
jgi:chromosome segregation ATPase